MRIGIDFDNTIVSYDALFHKVALETGRMPASVPVSKVAVRDYLRHTGREDEWTEMQGYVYGARMCEASAYPGALTFMRSARNAGHDLFVVSHKTRHPFRGERYDLHAAARGWIAKSMTDDNGCLIEPDRVFFELTKKEKLERAEKLGVDYFIDDLPEILNSTYFPKNAKPVLFDPDGNHASEKKLLRLCSWADVSRHLGVHSE